MTTKAAEARCIKSVADYIAEGLPEKPERARRAMAIVWRLAETCRVT